MTAVAFVCIYMTAIADFSLKNRGFVRGSFGVSSGTVCGYVPKIDVLRRKGELNWGRVLVKTLERSRRDKTDRYLYKRVRTSIHPSYRQGTQAPIIAKVFE